MEQTIATHEVTLEGTYADLTNNFSAHKPTVSPFDNSGLMIDRVAVTGKSSPVYSGAPVTLGEVLIDEQDVPEEFFIAEGKATTVDISEERQRRTQTASGHVYHYAEGAMVFPDALDRPSRTIITGEGGAGASRFKHVVKTPSGRYRRLVPPARTGTIKHLP